jgi:hypothetical protein
LARLLSVANHFAINQLPWSKAFRRKSLTTIMTFQSFSYIPA